MTEPKRAIWTINIGFLVVTRLIVTSADCPSGWIRHEEACYRLIPAPDGAATYIQSSDACYNVSGWLVEPKSQSANDYIRSLLPIDTTGAFLGGRHDSSDWKWDGGDAITYTNWEAGQASPAAGNCVVMRNTGKWNNADCMRTAPHIVCQTIPVGIDWVLTTETSSWPFANTESHVAYRLVGSLAVSRFFTPPNIAKARYLRRAIDEINLRTAQIGELASVSVSITATSDSWRLSKVRLLNTESGVRYRATCNCWVTTGTSKTIALSKVLKSYEIRLRTSDIAGAATDTSVTGTLFGKAGNAPLSLNRAAYDEFERGNTDVFAVTTADLGDITHITLVMASQTDDWHLDRVTVKDPTTNKEYGNVCNCWIGRVIAGLSKNIALGERIQYDLSVVTSDLADADTTSDVSMTIYGHNITTTATLSLPGTGFRRATTDRLSINAFDVGEIVEADVHLVDSSLPWHMRLITVKNMKRGGQWVLYCNCWIPDGGNKLAKVSAHAYAGKLPLMCDASFPKRPTPDSTSYEIFRQYALTSGNIGHGDVFWAWVERDADGLVYSYSSGSTISNFTLPSGWMLGSGIVAPSGECGAVRTSDANKTLYMVDCNVKHAKRLCSTHLSGEKLMSTWSNCFPTWRSSVITVDTALSTCESDCDRDVTCLGVSVMATCLLHKTAHDNILNALVNFTNPCNCLPLDSWRTKMKFIIGYDVDGTRFILDYCKVSTLLPPPALPVVVTTTPVSEVTSTLFTSMAVSSTGAARELTSTAMFGEVAPTTESVDALTSTKASDLEILLTSSMSTRPILVSSSNTPTTLATSTTMTTATTITAPPETTTITTPPATTTTTTAKTTTTTTTATTTTTTATTTTTTTDYVQPPGAPYCSCDCTYWSPPSNDTDEQKLAFIEKILSNFTAIPKSNTVRYKMSKISVADHRTSATGIGIVGGILLSLVITALILSDVPILMIHARTAFSNIKSIFVSPSTITHK